MPTKLASVKMQIGEKRLRKASGQGKETIIIRNFNREAMIATKCASRETLGARDYCHNEREIVRYTLATGIQLQSIVLKLTPEDTCKHQYVSGKRRAEDSVCVCV